MTIREDEFLTILKEEIAKELKKNQQINEGFTDFLDKAANGVSSFVNRGYQSRAEKMMKDPKMIKASVNIFAKCISYLVSIRKLVYDKDMIDKLAPIIKAYIPEQFNAYFKQLYEFAMAQRLDNNTPQQTQPIYEGWLNQTINNGINNGVVNQQANPYDNAVGSGAPGEVKTMVDNFQNPSGGTPPKKWARASSVTFSPRFNIKKENVRQAFVVMYMICNLGRADKDFVSEIDAECVKNGLK